MIDLSRRSEEAEVIDFPERLDSDEMAVVLRELALVNQWLGGAEAALGPLKKLIDQIRPGADNPVRVVDFGAGGGDVAADLADWARSRGYAVRIAALDFNLEACRLARLATAQYPEIDVVCGDAFGPCLKHCDFVLCSAFLHHFSEAQIVRLLKGFQDIAGRAIVVNDLQRSRAAYIGIRLLTLLLSRSAAVKNDGPLSVRKGFRREELERIMAACRFRGVEIDWRWAFRYSVVIPVAGSGAAVKQIANDS